MFTLTALKRCRQMVLPILLMLIGSVSAQTFTQKGDVWWTNFNGVIWGLSMKRTSQSVDKIKLYNPADGVVLAAIGDTMKVSFYFADDNPWNLGIDIRPTRYRDPSCTGGSCRGAYPGTLPCYDASDAWCRSNFCLSFASEQMNMPPKPSGSGNIDMTFYYPLPRSICDQDMMQYDSLWFIAGSYDHRKYEFFMLKMDRGGATDARSSAIAAINSSPVQAAIERNGVTFETAFSRPFTISIMDLQGRKIIKRICPPSTRTVRDLHIPAQCGILEVQSEFGIHWQRYSIY
ncbi:MAG: hypothetical protein GF350_15920 [Chitinivibrionales bacterium]|nr:hypothetical protein [Chitinivibrionales bacterium]